MWGFLDRLDIKLSVGKMSAAGGVECGEGGWTSSVDPGGGLRAYAIAATSRDEVQT